MLEEYQAVIATIRSPHTSSKWLAFAIFESPGTSVKRSVDAAHSKTTKRFGKMACTACLSSVGCVNLVRFCRCFFHADRPRTARDHVPARQVVDLMVGVVSLEGRRGAQR